VKSSPNQSDSIQAVATIATLLMQKYEKSSRSKGVDDIERWPIDSQAFQFLQETDNVETIDDLKEVSQDCITTGSKSLTIS
jgi:hypothetical protein